MNGSRYENFDLMNEVHKKRELELKERRALKVRYNQPEVQEEILDLDILNQQDSLTTNKFKRESI